MKLKSSRDGPGAPQVNCPYSLALETCPAFVKGPKATAEGSRCWLALGYTLGCCRGSDLCSWVGVCWRLFVVLLYFLTFQSSGFSQEKELLSSWGLQHDILASNFFFSQAKHYLGNGLKPIVHAGFMWLAALGGCGLKYIYRDPCKAFSLHLILSCTVQDQKALWTPYTMTGFSNKHPKKNKPVESDVDLDTALYPHKQAS